MAYTISEKKEEYYIAYTDGVTYHYGFSKKGSVLKTGQETLETFDDEQSALDRYKELTGEYPETDD